MLLLPLLLSSFSSTTGLSVQQSGSSRHSRAEEGAGAPMCPNACSGHGYCDAPRGFCWCDAGYGGFDCAQEMPDSLTVSSLASPDLQEALGRYKVDSMYLKETKDLDEKAKWIHYEEDTNGWVISEMESPCTDDVCFFAYQKQRAFPPESGYVYGAPNMEVYYKPMLFDSDGSSTPGRRHGPRLSVEYTPDPGVTDVSDLTVLNGKYILQPRYVHEETGKYAIFPIDFNTQRTWVFAGLLGTPRKWRVLFNSTGARLQMYQPPLPSAEGSTAVWTPGEGGLELVASCLDKFPPAACQSLRGSCGINEKATQWVRDCCRATCGSCQISRNACQMGPPPTAPSFLDLARAKRREVANLKLKSKSKSP